MRPKTPTRLLETVVRVTFFVPQTSDRERKAVLAVIRYLKTQCLRRVAVTGFTHSILRQPVFTGFWWDPEVRRWFPPKGVVMFVIDYSGKAEDRAFRRTMSRLRQIVGGRYAAFGSPQKELWVVGHRGVRYA